MRIIALVLVLLGLSACAERELCPSSPDGRDTCLVTSHMGDLEDNGGYRLHAEVSDPMTVDDCMAIGAALRRSIPDPHTLFECYQPDQQ